MVRGYVFQLLFPTTRSPADSSSLSSLSTPWLSLLGFRMRTPDGGSPRGSAPEGGSLSALRRLAALRRLRPLRTDLVSYVKLA